MSSIAARRANKRACPLQPNGILSRGTHGILAQMGSGAPTQVGRGPHAVREARCALVRVSYCPWTMVSSRKQRHLPIDARTNHQSIYM